MASSPVSATALRPSALVWSDSAPRRVIEAEDVRTSGKGWRTWVEHLRRRRPLRMTTRLHGTRASALAWGWRTSELGAGAAALLVRLHDFARKKGKWAGHAEGELQAWLDGNDRDPVSAAAGLEAIAWTNVLPRLAGTSSPQLWWRAWEDLVQLAQTPVSVDEDQLASQILGGELALTLAGTFPEFAVSRELADGGKQAISDGWQRILDSDGSCAAVCLDQLRPLTACWTRSYLAGAAIDRGFWEPSAIKRLRAVLLHALQWTRRDGSQALEGVDDAMEFGVTHLSVMLAALGTGRTRRLVYEWLPRYRKQLPAPLLAKHKGKLPAPSTHSEWAQASVLRTDWSRRAITLAVAWNTATPRIELSLGGELLVNGPWETKILRDGAPIHQTACWEEVCWVSDDDADYLELEQQLAPGVSLQRQMLLARGDRFLLVADAILTQQAARWDYAMTLPLAPRVAFESSDETTEGVLLTRTGPWRVLPLALAEWRSSLRESELRSTAEGLGLRQSAMGAALFAPLWIDFDPGRQQAPCTWRQLTVAEDRVIMPRDRAAGYRVQIGKRQWLAYRSLGDKGNRTLLGHNLVTDFLVGRFQRDGTVETLVEIE